MIRGAVLSFLLMVSLLGLPSVSFAVAGFLVNGTCYPDQRQAESVLFSGPSYNFNYFDSSTPKVVSIHPEWNGSAWQFVEIDISGGVASASSIAFPVSPQFFSCDTSINSGSVYFDVASYAQVLSWLLGLFVISAGAGFVIRVFRGRS